MDGRRMFMGDESKLEKDRVEIPSVGRSEDGTHNCCLLMSLPPTGSSTSTPQDTVPPSLVTVLFALNLFAIFNALDTSKPPQSLCCYFPPPDSPMGRGIANVAAVQSAVAAFTQSFLVETCGFSKDDASQLGSHFVRYTQDSGNVDVNVAVCFGGVLSSKGSGMDCEWLENLNGLGKSQRFTCWRTVYFLRPHFAGIEHHGGVSIMLFCFICFCFVSVCSLLRIGFSRPVLKKLHSHWVVEQQTVDHDTESASSGLLHPNASLVVRPYVLCDRTNGKEIANNFRGTVKQSKRTWTEKHPVHSENS